MAIIIAGSSLFQALWKLLTEYITIIGIVTNKQAPMYSAAKTYSQVERDMMFPDFAHFESELLAAITKEGIAQAKVSTMAITNTINLAIRTGSIFVFSQN
jgi:hypothetical protein